ncbi:MAG: desulfoferrodoxin [Bacteroidaceae bacterium]|nr:desulfoferrodoxin [Bacteroidaceae bacterium]
METLFYVCPICGNLVTKIEDGGVTPVCCGEPMEELHPGSVDASVEKHVPVIERIDECTVIVKVGSTAHPMTPEHHIVFIWLETVHGGQLRYLNRNGVINETAQAEFCTCKDPLVAVYAFCNLHGLWKSLL